MTTYYSRMHHYILVICHHDLRSVNAMAFLPGSKLLASASRNEMSQAVGYQLRSGPADAQGPLALLKLLSFSDYIAIF